MSSPKEEVRSQVAFRDDPQTLAKASAAAEYEELSFSDFVRKLFHYGLRQYELSGSLHELRRREREATLERQVQLNKGTHESSGSKKKSDRPKTA